MSELINSHSPCIRNCCLNEDDICLGCYRSLDEILIWSQANDIKKREILMKSQERKQKK
jgi:predicted Fe-S protein YdhL (DUF1289 family)